MKQTILLVAQFLFCSILCSQNSVGELSAKLEKLNQQIQLPGFATVVIKNNEVIYQQGFGYADLDTKKTYSPDMIQNIGSVSKTFIGISIMKAVEEGLLDLDADINQYLPFKIINPHHPNQPITIRHLATHTSSINDRDLVYAKSYVRTEKEKVNLWGIGFINKLSMRIARKNEMLSLEKYLKNVLHKDGKWYKKKNFLKHAPGTTYQYSNIGAGLAAYILEQATGEGFKTYTQKHILNPLKMDNSGWSFADVNMGQHVTTYFKNNKPVPKYTLITYPDGGMITSVADLSIYLMELMKGYLGKGALLQPASYQELMSNQFATEHFTPYAGSEKSGLFMALRGEDIIGHGGSDPGIITLMYFDKEKNVGRILFTNGDQQGKQQGAVMSEMFKALGTFGDAYEH